MERFVHNANIEHYRRLIAESENDAALKDTVRRLGHPYRSSDE
jgi:hypothetical protein